ncbi:MAG: hypothetical protein AAF797_08975 [Planctomycetota bacterium]
MKTFLMIGVLAGVSLMSVGCETTQTNSNKKPSYAQKKVDRSVQHADYRLQQRVNGSIDRTINDVFR